MRSFSSLSASSRAASASCCRFSSSAANSLSMRSCSILSDSLRAASSAAKRSFSSFLRRAASASSLRFSSNFSASASCSRFNFSAASLSFSARSASMRARSSFCRCCSSNIILSACNLDSSRRRSAAASVSPWSTLFSSSPHEEPKKSSPLVADTDNFVTFNGDEVWELPGARSAPPPVTCC